MDKRRKVLEKLVGRVTKTLYEGMPKKDEWGVDQALIELDKLELTEDEIVTLLNTPNFDIMLSGKLRTDIAKAIIKARERRG